VNVGFDGGDRRRKEYSGRDVHWNMGGEVVSGAGAFTITRAATCRANRVGNPSRLLLLVALEDRELRHDHCARPTRSCELTARRSASAPPGRPASKARFRFGGSTWIRSWCSWAVSAEIRNLLDRRDQDIAYFYASRVRPGDPVREQVHFHPVEPIQARVAVTARF
jgi:hypothetical protein